MQVLVLVPLLVPLLLPLPLPLPLLVPLPAQVLVRAPAVLREEPAFLVVPAPGVGWALALLAQAALARQAVVSVAPVFLAAVQ